MDDLISRKWLMECVDEGWIKFDTEKDTNTYIHLVRDIAPPAQPDIVRCKDCQFFDPTDVPSTEFPNMKRCGWLKIVMTEDGYCSYGRRKEMKDDYLPSAQFKRINKGTHEITESDKISYAVICDKFPSPHVYFNTYDEAEHWAKFDQPNYRPFYIIKRSEHFEIVGGVR